MRTNPPLGDEPMTRRDLEATVNRLLRQAAFECSRVVMPEPEVIDLVSDEESDDRPDGLENGDSNGRADGDEQGELRRIYHLHFVAKQQCTHGAFLFERNPQVNAM